MTFALVGTAGVASSGAASAAVTPAWGTSENRTAGNLLVCLCFGGGATTLPTTPAGWSVGAQVVGGTTVTATVFYTVATGADAAPTIAAATSVGWACSLAEFSGGATTTPLDRSAAIGTTATTPIVATTAGVDAAVGELVVMCGCARYSTSVAETLLHTLNNGTPVSLDNNNANATSGHRYFAYAVTTSAAAADSDSFSFPATNVNGAAIAIASFKLSGGAPSPLPDLNMALHR